MQSLQTASNRRLSAEDCAWELLDAAPPVTWYIRRTLRGHRGGLSVAQFRAMARIANEPSTSLSMVAEDVGLSLPTASRVVAGLVNKGLLKRGGCAEDRRQCLLGITAKGQIVLDSAWSAAQKFAAAELEQITPAQRAAVADAMRLLKRVFGSVGLPRTGRDAQVSQPARTGKNGRLRS